MKIEFALMFEDRTWDTEIIDVPFDEEAQLDDIQEWVNINLLGQGTHRKVVLMPIYNDEPDA